MRLAMAALVVGVVSIGACGPRVPTASVEEHRRLAYMAEELGIAHKALYDPWQMVATIPCMELCFNPWTNPTDVHNHAAKQLWRLAKWHRRASRKLRVAEERACAGVPEHERDIDRFVECANILAVDWPQQQDEPFIIELAVPIPMVDEFRATRACLVARNEARGHEFPAPADCPLVVCGMQAAIVAIHEASLRVELRGGDARARAQQRDRLRALIAATPEDLSGGEADAPALK
jgi:hypothetical protein